MGRVQEGRFLGPRAQVDGQGMWPWSEGQIKKGVGVSMVTTVGEPVLRTFFFSVKEGEATCVECGRAGMENKV